MQEKKELKLTNDYIFKKVFGKPGNEEILKDLLESILEIKIEKIEVMAEVELEREKIDDKIGILDIKAKVNEKITLDIEMQVRNGYNMIERSLFYWSGLYYTGIQKGERFERNNKVITINILKYNLFKEGNYHEVGKIHREYKKEILTDKLEIHFIELPKFLETKEKGHKRLRQWLELICNEREDEVQMAVKENKQIAKAKKELEYLTGDEAVKRIAYLREKAERDYINNMLGAKEEGIEIGGKIGEKRGRTSEKEQIAMEMIKEGMEDKVIIKITKITEERLKELKEKVKNKML